MEAEEDADAALVAEAVGLPLLAGLCEKERVPVADAEGSAETDWLKLAVAVPVSVIEAAAVGDSLALAAPEDVADKLNDCAVDGEGSTEGEPEMLGAGEPEPEGHTLVLVVPVCVGAIEPDDASDCDELTEPEIVWDARIDNDGEAEND